MREFPFERIDELYRGVILSHYRNPRNKDPIQNPDIEYNEYNPVCGDQVVLQLKLSDGRIGEAGFSGEGCAISQASASMLADSLLGKTLEEATELADIFTRMMNGRAPSAHQIAQLGELESLQGVRKFPVRIKCALLAWTALEEGILQWEVKAGKG